MLEDRRVPVLIDLNGDAVHRWDGVRAIGRVRLLRNGHLLSINRDRTLSEVNWEGRPVWEYTHPEPDELIHHDVIRLTSGRTLAIVRSKLQPTDYLLEVDEHGQESWRWDSARALDSFPDAARHPLDPVHMNSVQELPPNPLFFSAVGGTVQPLANGNVLVTSSEGGRVFELTRSGELVWEWVPPWELPMRAARYAPDHCPQLSALGQPALEGVAAPSTPHVDRHLSMFALPEHFGRRQILGARRTFLNRPRGCRTLLLPPRAEMVLEYGIDPEKQSDVPLQVQFTASLSTPNQPEPEVLVREVVSFPGEPWRRRTFDLSAHALERVQLCLEAAITAGEARPQAVVWSNPVIRPAQIPGTDPGSSTRDPELERKQLEALGYVN